jgi:hypothetical protein
LNSEKDDRRSTLVDFRDVAAFLSFWVVIPNPEREERNGDHVILSEAKDLKGVRCFACGSA